MKKLLIFFSALALQQGVLRATETALPDAQLIRVISQKSIIPLTVNNARFFYKKNVQLSTQNNKARLCVSFSPSEEEQLKSLLLSHRKDLDSSKLPCPSALLTFKHLRNTLAALDKSPSHSITTSISFVFPDTSKFVIAVLSFAIENDKRVSCNIELQGVSNQASEEVLRLLQVSLCDESACASSAGEPTNWEQAAQNVKALVGICLGIATLVAAIVAEKARQAAHDAEMAERRAKLNRMKPPIRLYT